MKVVYDILGMFTPKMRRDASGTEAIVEDCFYDYVVSFDIIINGKGEMRNTHSMMSIKNRMYSSGFGKLGKSPINICHEMIKYPRSGWCIEILGFDKIEFCQSRETNAFRFKVHFGEPEDGLLPQPNHKRVSCPRNRASRVERVHRHARQVVRRQKRFSQATTKDSPSSGLSRQCSSRQFVEAWEPSLIPFARNYIKNGILFKEPVFQEVFRV